MGQFSNWSFKDIEKFLLKNNFEFVGAKGSHHFYKQGTEVLVVVPKHGSKAVAIGTMLSIIKQSKIDKKDWR